ncbi:MAG: FAD-dependent oxidoreductase [Acidobacteriota bacterium]
MYSARVLEKRLLAESSQCFHIECDIPELQGFSFEAGQFISMIAEDARGKSHTRAYSIASASRGNRFDLCLDRVDGGFFSNQLANSKPGDTFRFHGPYGLFVLRRPLVDSVMVAAGTGIAPIRGFVETLFPGEQEDRSEGKHFWLVYGARHASEIYYQHYFEKTAAEHHNFHFFPTLTHPEVGWEGLRGDVEVQVRSLLLNGAMAKQAYICGLNEMVAANRAQFKELGWDRKQIVFERYD